MSLYGLDILINKEEKKYLAEINGVNSGMSGFWQVYGDGRVEKKVWKMLEEKHGTITVNDIYSIAARYAKAHPVKVKIGKIIKPFAKVLYGLLSAAEQHKFHLSRDAHTEWMDEPLKASETTLPFLRYKGQESTVLNCVNESNLKHPTVNSYVAEEIANNKFLQYMLLKDTELKEYLPKTALVGLGGTDTKKVQEILDEHGIVVLKPILGSQGRGVRLLTRNEAEKYAYSRGTISEINPLFDSFRALRNKKPKAKYLEDLIEKQDFSFEKAIDIMQPFINTREENKYSRIRAIVCNGEYVDAYRAVSEKEKVNISQEAKAEAFKEEGFGELCEKIVQIFEKRCEKLLPETFRYVLYNKYLTERGRTSDEQRHVDARAPFMTFLSNNIMHRKTI